MGEEKRSLRRANIKAKGVDAIVWLAFLSLAIAKKRLLLKQPRSQLRLLMLWSSVLSLQRPDLVLMVTLSLVR